MKIFTDDFKKFLNKYFHISRIIAFIIITLLIFDIYFRFQQLYNTPDKITTVKDINIGFYNNKSALEVNSEILNYTSNGWKLYDITSNAKEHKIYLHFER
jgi:signal transduction histidine kinase